jgi:hypothetical protein
MTADFRTTEGYVQLLLIKMSGVGVINARAYTFGFLVVLWLKRMSGGEQHLVFGLNTTYVGNENTGTRLRILICDARSMTNVSTFSRVVLTVPQEIGLNA